MFHSFRTRAEARAITENLDGPYSSWNSAQGRGRFNPLADRLFDAVSRRADASHRPIPRCDVVDLPDGPVIAHHANLLKYCNAMTVSTEPALPDWDFTHAGPGQPLLFVNLDVFGDVDCAVSYLQEFRKIAPLVSIIIASSGFARDEFDATRVAITDISLRLPLSGRSLEAALCQISREADMRAQVSSAPSLYSRL